MWPLRFVPVNMIETYHSRNPASFDFFSVGGGHVMLGENGRGQSYATRSRMHGRGRSTSLPVASVMLLSSRLKSWLLQIWWKIGRCGTVEICRFRILCCRIFMWRYMSPAVHNDVRLGRILMAVVDVREEVSVQLFSSYVPRYTYVSLFRKQHKNGMSLFLTQCSSATYSEMSGWTKTCPR
jgi:hypothetical protein